MSTRFYPFYQKGNPQLRVFLPNFWMKLVRSEEPLPPNVVLFRTSIQMTEYDVKNYLEKIYKIPVVDVKLTIKMGDIQKSIFTKGLVKKDDYKEALVYMPKDFQFEFPQIDIQEEKSPMQRYKDLKEDYAKKSGKNSIELLPKWFIK